MQPFFVVNITVPSANSSGVYNCISQKGERWCTTVLLSLSAGLSPLLLFGTHFGLCLV